MLIEQFSYFTFSCLQCPLKDIVKTLSADLLENDKQKLSYKPFMFDLYDNSPLMVERILRKHISLCLQQIEIFALCIPTIQTAGIL